MSEAQVNAKSSIHEICLDYNLTESGDEIVTSDVKSDYSRAALLGGSKETVGSKAKALWKQLKEENEARKTKIQHVTTEEATAITGYGDNGSKSNGKDGKGDKRIAAAFVIC